MKNCPNCGAVNGDKMEKCNSCGRSFDAEAPVVIAAAPAVEEVAEEVAAPVVEEVVEEVAAPVVEETVEEVTAPVAEPIVEGVSAEPVLEAETEVIPEAEPIAEEAKYEEPKYEAPPYVNYNTATPVVKEITGTVGLILGLIAIVLVVVFGFIGSCSGVGAVSLVFTIAGLVLSIIGLVISSRDRKATGNTCARANAGFVLSLIALILGAILLVIGICCVGCISCAACAAASALVG